MLFRNHPATLRLLDDWFQAPSVDVCRAWKYEHPREQKCLNLLAAERFQQEIKLVDYDVLNGRDGGFIRHFMGLGNEERTVLLRDFLCGLNLGDYGTVSCDRVCTSKPCPRRRLIDVAPIVLLTVMLTLFSVSVWLRYRNPVKK